MRRTRFQQGSLQLVDRSGGKKTWEYRWYELQSDGSRRRRNLMVGSLEQYPNETAARDGIAKRLTTAFGRSDADVSAAIATAQRLYGQNVFPEMKVTWGTYTTELGHVDIPGCFRCHDDNHTSKDGRKISQDCETCHKIE